MPLCGRRRAGANGGTPGSRIPGAGVGGFHRRFAHAAFCLKWVSPRSIRRSARNARGHTAGVARRGPGGAWQGQVCRRRHTRLRFSLFFLAVLADALTIPYLCLHTPRHRYRHRCASNPDTFHSNRDEMKKTIPTRGRDRRAKVALSPRPARGMPASEKSG